jgi:hypothetical protein
MSSCCNFCTNIHSKNTTENNNENEIETNIFIKIWNWCRENIQYFLLGIGVIQILSGIYIYAVKTSQDNSNSMTIIISTMFTSGISHSSIASININHFKKIKFILIPILIIAYIIIINSYTLSILLNHSVDDYRMTIIILIETFIVTLWSVTITYKLSKLLYRSELNLDLNLNNFKFKSDNSSNVSNILDDKLLEVI